MINKKEIEDKFYNIWITKNKHNIKYGGEVHDLCFYYFKKGLEDKK